MRQSRPDRPIPSLLVPLRFAVRRWRRLRIQLQTRGKARLSSRTALGAGCVILSPSHFTTEGRVLIARELHCEVDVRIQDDVLISSRVSFIGNDHEFDASSTSVIAGQRMPSSEIVIEGNNLIGFGTTIIAPSVVGRGAIVGAGSLVIGDVDPGWVYVGRPARPVRPRGQVPVVD